MTVDGCESVLAKVLAVMLCLRLWLGSAIVRKGRKVHLLVLRWGWAPRTWAPLRVSLSITESVSRAQLFHN